MISLLKQEALTHGDRLQILSIKRLQDVKAELEIFKRNADINDFQEWILNSMYKFDVPDTEFTVKSIIIIAIPHPSYAKVEFLRQGKKYNFMSPAMSDFDSTEKYINDFLMSKGYHIKSAQNLPLKRLAAKSGLSFYGRNNICYIEGMGSFFSFAAYFSDIPCDNDDWMEMRQADTCNNCNICLSSCPTGAIIEKRFLIDNERCLSYFNESSEEFPEWIPLSAHHCLYDCFKCQIICPMNKDFVKNILESIKFNEDETDKLLSGSSFDSFSPVLKQKSKMLGLNQWHDAIPRNLKILFELSDKTDYNL